jgi:group I intron endonuclease
MGNKSGIYKIINTVNGQFYIGSSVNILIRWKRHRSRLNLKKHENVYLQRAWDKHGKAKFVFEIIEFVSDNESLLAREQYYLDTLMPFSPKGYNIAKNSSGGDNITFNPNKENIIKKIKLAQKAIWDDARKDQYSKLFEGQNNPNYGNNWSETQKKLLSEKAKTRYNLYGHPFKGKKFKDIVSVEKSLEWRQKLSHSAKLKTKGENPFFGKNHTDETKSKLSKIRAGKYCGGQNKTLIINGVEYDSAGQASKIINVKSSTIRWRCISKNYEGYKYK